MNKFRIEVFGSIEYKFSEIILRTREETIKFLEDYTIENKYEIDVRRLWCKPEEKITLLDLRLPVLLQLEYTYACNLSCKYCYAASSPERKETMNFDKFRYLIKLIDTEDIFDIHVLGGEPFLMPQYIKYLLENLQNKFITIATNGTLVVEEFCRWIINSKNKVVISIGVDGHTKDTHNATRGGFDRVCETLKCLTDKGIPIQVTTCVTPYNYDKLEELVNFLMKYNVFCIQILPVETSHLPKKLAFALDISNLYSNITKKLEKLIRKYNDKIAIDVSFSLPYPEEKKKKGNNIIKYGPCMAGITKAVINPMCQMGPCPATRKAPKVKISSSLEHAFQCLKDELRKGGVKTIYYGDELRTQKCCDLFGFGQQPGYC